MNIQKLETMYDAKVIEIPQKSGELKLCIEPEVHITMSVKQLQRLLNDHLDEAKLKIGWSIGRLW